MVTKKKMPSGYGEGWFREDVYYKSYQRDARTSLEYKNGLLTLSVICSLFIWLSCAMYVIVYINFSPQIVDYIWLGLCILVCLMAGVMFIINGNLLLEQRYAWMTDVLQGGQCVGRDNLDCDEKRYVDNVRDIKRRLAMEDAQFEADYERANRLTV